MSQFPLGHAASVHSVHVNTSPGSFLDEQKRPGRMKRAERPGRRGTERGWGQKRDTEGAAGSCRQGLTLPPASELAC